MVYAAAALLWSVCSAWQWTLIEPAGPIPTPRFGSAVSFFQQLGSAGGPLICGGSDYTNFFTDCSILFPGSPWRYRNVVPAGEISGMALHTVVTNANFCLLYGGNSSTPNPDAEPTVLSVGPWGPIDATFVNNATQARYGHTAIVAPDGVSWVIFGGASVDTGVELNDVAILQIGDQNPVFTWSSWVIRGTIPSPRKYHSATRFGDKMVVFGGKQGDTVFSDVFMLYLTGSQQGLWVTQATVSASPLFGHRAAIVNALFIVVGGLTEGAAPPPSQSRVMSLNMNSWAWSFPSVQGPPPPMWYQPSVMLLNVPGDTVPNIVYVGGGTDEFDGFAGGDVYLLSQIGEFRAHGH